MNVQENLKAYLDGELAEAEAAQVRAAIEADPQLQKEVRELSQITESLKTADVPSTNAPGRETLLRSIALKSKRSYWLRVSAAICGCAVIAALFFPIFAQDKGVAETASYAADEAKVGTEKGSMMPSENSEVAADRAAASPPMRDMAKSEAHSPGVAAAARDVVRNATMRVGVPDVQKSVAEATDQTTALGGYVQSSTESVGENDLPTAQLQLRIPAAKFTAAVSMVRGMGKVISSSITGEDVTAQRVEAEERAKELRKQELYYMEMLRGARRESAANEIRWKIREVREQIAEMDRQARDVKRVAAYSTIDLSLEQRPPTTVTKEGWADDVLATAVSSLGTIGRLLGSAGIYILVFAPLWVPAVIIAHIVRKRST